LARWFASMKGFSPCGFQQVIMLANLLCSMLAHGVKYENYAGIGQCWAISVVPFKPLGAWFSFGYDVIVTQRTVKSV